MGSRMDSGGVCTEHLYQLKVSVGLALLVSFLYHLSKRWTSLPILTRASLSISSSAVSISEGMGL